MLAGTTSAKCLVSAILSCRLLGTAGECRWEYMVKAGSNPASLVNDCRQCGASLRRMHGELQVSGSNPDRMQVR
jgi:hypothetical protein